MMFNKLKNGFTLAEVLITLVIIGVVAALTIPTAINKYQKISMAKRLKASYSLIQQAINGSAAGLENPNWVKEIDDSPVGSISKSEYIKKYIINGLRVTKDFGNTWPVWISGHPVFHDVNGNQIHPTSTTGSDYYTVALANGSFLYVGIGQNNDNTYSTPTIYVDVNGWKLPNVLGKDLFGFQINNKKQIYLAGYDKPRDTIINTCVHSVYSYNITCQSLVQHDNWEFKDDYPWW